MTEQLAGLTGAQKITVSDAVRTQAHRRDQRDDLAPHMRATATITKLGGFTNQHLGPSRSAGSAGNTMPALATKRSS